MSLVETVLLVAGGAGCAGLTAVHPCIGVGMSGMGGAFSLTMMVIASVVESAPAKWSLRWLAGVMVAVLSGIAPIVVGFILIFALLSGDPGTLMFWPSGDLPPEMRWFWWLMPVTGVLAGCGVASYLLSYDTKRSR